MPGAPAQQLQDIVVLDNGGSTFKLGSALRPQELKAVPNMTARVKGEKQVLVGEDVLGCSDVSSLMPRRPMDRGFVVAWDMQKEIWARALRGLFKSQPAACGLVLTEPYLNLPALREAALQVAFEELGFGAVYLTTPAALALRWHAHRQPGTPAAAAGCGLVVDAGFSYTHAVPLFDWRVLGAGVRRIDLGGKALTNYMKELVSYRSVNLMDEAYLLEHIKEQLCFVSQDVQRDLELARQRRSPHRREYVLPDGVTSTWGYLCPDPQQQPGSQQQPSQPGPPKEAVLVVNNERFMVPEVLFHPTDIGMEEAGLAEAVLQAVQAVHPHLHALLYSNVLLTGGTSRCPGFKERLYSELRPLVPDDYELNIHCVDDPVLCAAQGACLLARSAEFGRAAITLQDWQQQGGLACSSLVDSLV